MTSVPVIEFAGVDDFDRIEEIETAADTILVELFSAADWPATTPAADRAAYPGFTLLLRIPDIGIVGFAQVLETHGIAHLEQVSVLPEHGRKGHGRMLVAAAKAEASRRGYRKLTLRTYRDVPWNAPFYASCGFGAIAPTSEFELHLVDVETQLRLDQWGTRIQMAAGLGSQRPLR